MDVQLSGSISRGKGKGRDSNREFLRFLVIARGSLEETKYHLILSRDLGYLSPERFSKLFEGYNEVGRMLNGLINSLKERHTNG